jgi:hypothetical protein
MHYSGRGAWMGQNTLRITNHEIENGIAIRLEGRITGPWVEVLRRAWMETVPRIGTRKVAIDLRDVTFADADGKKVLREMYDRNNVELLTGSTWTQYLAEEIGAKIKNSFEERSENANRA